MIMIQYKKFFTTDLLSNIAFLCQNYLQKRIVRFLLLQLNVFYVFQTQEYINFIKILLNILYDKWKYSNEIFKLIIQVLLNTDEC